MSDSDDRGGAWRVAPSQYLARRQPAFRIPQPLSLYLTMADGCRLAADVYLPDPIQESDTRSTWPTICIFTPYYRRFRLKPGSNRETTPNCDKYSEFLVTS